MNLREAIESVATQTGVDAATVGKVLRAYVALVRNVVATSEVAKVGGIGRFVTKPTPKGTNRTIFFPSESK